MTIRYSTPERAAAVVSGMIAGVEEVYAKLDSLLPRRITVTRSFAARKAAVFRAHTEATRMRRWMASADTPLPH